MKPVSRVLGGADGLMRSLFGRARRLAKIEQAVHALLDAEPRAHCRVANLYRDTLLVHADSPAWAARLRYMAPQLLRELHRLDPTLGTVRTLKVKVCPSTPPHTTPGPRPSQAKRLSPETADFIASVARTTADPGLKRVLSSLAARAKRGASDD